MKGKRKEKEEEQNRKEKRKLGKREVRRKKSQNENILLEYATAHFSYKFFFREHIEVDVYGACGSYQCEGSLHEKTDICVQMLSNQYKFYLALENSYVDNR